MRPGVQPMMPPTSHTSRCTSVNGVLDTFFCDVHMFEWCINVVHLFQWCIDDVSTDRSATPATISCRDSACRLIRLIPLPEPYHLTKQMQNTRPRTDPRWTRWAHLRTDDEREGPRGTHEGSPHTAAEGECAPCFRGCAAARGFRSCALRRVFEQFL